MNREGSLPLPPEGAELEATLGQVRRRLDRLQGLAEERVRGHAEARKRETEALEFLDLAPRAEARIRELTTALFGEILDDVEANLSHALQEILGQQRTVQSRREIKGGRLHVSLYVQSPEGDEDILVGQGGSVCNILSVGLRLIALSRLDAGRHRSFLVLDEQDCWLKPELVPVFMKLIARIAEKLELQVLVISHHPVDLFAVHAKRIYELRPRKEEGAQLLLRKAPTTLDSSADSSVSPEGTDAL